MPEYKWSCQACDEVNKAGTDACKSCGCPSEMSANNIELWKTGKYIEPTIPNILANSFGPVAELGKCPNCVKLMFFRERKCPHCGYNLTDEEQQQLNESFETTTRKSLVTAIILVPIIAFILYWVSVQALG